MRVSELIQKLQEFMEDYHSDPEIYIQTETEWKDGISHVLALEVELIRGGRFPDKAILEYD